MWSCCSPPPEVDGTSCRNLAIVLAAVLQAIHGRGQARSRSQIAWMTNHRDTAPTWLARLDLTPRVRLPDTVGGPKKL